MSQVVQSSGSTHKPVFSSLKKDCLQRHPLSFSVHRYDKEKENNIIEILVWYTIDYFISAVFNSTHDTLHCTEIT